MTAPTEPEAPPADAPRRLRASDAQREAVVHQLHGAVGLGLLTVEEGHERTATAYAARYVDELHPLTHDLPDPAPEAPGWRAVASSASLQARTSLLGAPSWSAARRRRRRVVLVVGVLVALLLVAAVVAAAIAGSGDYGYGPGYYHHWHD
ncbi:DUF1707 SHOCT-like domain-containing protein [Petropleomorpha daqingensis]|uniref:DUF1707 domain-containing protein n=1 Tax=Petropleomorpha daqingensis TaxID=2026353 RepID=A0A853CPM9_9ACTN|nr:DUF1707 domain-containing protein [Petropleomorpha daqingensis]NYJ08739.1 hypothetical protein [Petropleomorpha daqingensis]